MSAIFDSLLGRLRKKDTSTAGSSFKGFFETSAELAALGVGEAGWYAIVGSTDSIWIWDTTTSTWKDSGYHPAADATFGVDSGVADAIVVNTINPIVTLTTWDEVTFIVSYSTTSSTPTLNVDGTGAITIKKSPTAALVAGDLVAGKIYKCVYNGTGTPFWQILNPESDITGDSIPLLVPSQFATVDAAYNEYKKQASASSSGNKRWVIAFDSKGIYDVSVMLNVIPGTTLALGAAASGLVINNRGTSINGITAGVGTATVELSTAAPPEAIVGGMIYFEKGWTQLKNNGCFEITDISGNFVTFKTPKMDVITESGSASKTVAFSGVVLRKTSPATTPLFFVSPGANLDMGASILSYRGQSELSNVNDVFINCSQGGIVFLSGLAHNFTFGVSGAQQSMFRQNTFFCLTGISKTALSLGQGASFTSSTSSSTASAGTWPTFHSCGDTMSPAVSLSGGTFIASGGFRLITKGNVGISASQSVLQFAYPYITNASLFDVNVINNTKMYVLGLVTPTIKVYADWNSQIVFDADSPLPSSAEWSLSNLPLPFNTTQQNGVFVGTVEKGGTFRNVVASELLTFKSENISANSASPITLTLPSTTVGDTTTAMRFTIQNKGSGIVTINSNDAKTISGAASITLSQWQSVDLELLAGAEWIIV